MPSRSHVVNEPICALIPLERLQGDWEIERSAAEFHITKTPDAGQRCRRSSRQAESARPWQRVRPGTFDRHERPLLLKSLNFDDPAIGQC